MTQRLSFRIALLVVGALALSLSACGDPQSQIVGRWKVTSDTSELVWDFARDGTVTSGDIKGRYSFGSSKRMNLQTPFATFIYEVEFAHDKMTWQSPNGTKTELSRIP